MKPRHDDKAVEIRLTGTKNNVFAVLTALGATCPGGWNLEVKTTKTRDTGTVQAYGRIVKIREAR